MKHTKLAFIFGLSLALLTGCNDDDESLSPVIDVPSTYNFTRNGESSVSYSGQTTRLNMLAEMKAYLGKGNNGEVISAQTLLDMFANENAPFANSDLNTADKQLENKTFAPDINFFKTQMTEAATASADVAANQTVADQGKSGLLERGNTGIFVLVNDKGWEYQQIIEKGLMGAVFLHQIYNVYLTDDRTGDAVDNVNLVEGKNYTAMEHHWDEAFGYWGVPVDLPDELAAEDKRFWASYSYGRNSLLSTASDLKDGFLRGRTAIVNNDANTREAAKDILYAKFELTTAATALHYINDAIENINDNDLGNLMHHMSEAYAFISALKYSPRKTITHEQIELILNTHFGDQANFWTVNVTGLNNAKQLLIELFPEMANVADEI